MNGNIFSHRTFDSTYCQKFLPLPPNTLSIKELRLYCHSPSFSTSNIQHSNPTSKEGDCRGQVKTLVLLFFLGLYPRLYILRAFSPFRRQLLAVTQVTRRYSSVFKSLVVYCSIDRWSSN